MRMMRKGGRVGGAARRGAVSVGAGAGEIRVGVKLLSQLGGNMLFWTGGKWQPTKIGVFCQMKG